MTEPTTLATSVLPGAGYVHLDDPVAIPCVITLSPGTSFAERVPVYKCTDDDGPFIAFLGVDNPHGRPLTAQLKRAHNAGSPVRVEAVDTEPEDEVPQSAPDLMQQIRDRLELPSLVVDFTEAKPQWTPEEMEEFRRRFIEAQRDTAIQILPIDSNADVTSHQIRAALLAVLNLHPADAHECPETDPLGGYTAYEPTCPTLLAIAKELGIEVADAQG